MRELYQKWLAALQARDDAEAAAEEAELCANDALGDMEHIQDPKEFRKHIARVAALRAWAARRHRMFLRAAQVAAQAEWAITQWEQANGILVDEILNDPNYL